MPGDDKSEPPPPPPTMEGLAALMTKLLSSMGDMKARMEACLTLLESRFTATFPSFTAPIPVPPQQHGEGIFYGVVPAAVALPQLGKKKAFAWEDACHVFAAVRLQAAARGLLAWRRLQEIRR